MAAHKLDLPERDNESARPMRVASVLHNEQSGRNSVQNITFGRVLYILGFSKHTPFDINLKEKNIQGT